MQPVSDRRLLYLIGQFPAVNHKYLLFEIQHLRRLGIDVRVASISPPDRPLEKLSADEREEAKRSYCVKRVPALRIALANISEFLWHPLRYLRGFFFSVGLAGPNPKKIAYHLAYFAEAVLVGRQMREQQISHVHAHFSATVALIATEVFPVTMSFTVHGFGELYDPSGTHLRERIQGSLFVRSVSQHGRSQLMLACDRSQWTKLIHVPLGIVPNEFVPVLRRDGTSPPHVLCVGRLSAEKGPSLLLEAAAILSHKNCALRVTFIGDGPERPYLETLAAELGIRQIVKFVGWVDPAEIKSAYAEADVCVLPSLAEGIPIVLMEAMAMQVPCVAPCITGIPELIENGIDGVLFTVGDAHDLADKLRQLVDSIDTRARIGASARRRVLRDYDMGRNSARFAEVLKEQLWTERPEDLPHAVRR